MQQWGILTSEVWEQRNNLFPQVVDVVVGKRTAKVETAEGDAENGSAEKRRSNVLGQEQDSMGGGAFLTLTFFDVLPTFRK